jgi:ubiquinone/menaquinone biosynthesis C-methylase UbiE
MGITHTAYSLKAEQYARYRWDYSAPAIQFIHERAHINAHTRMADIGSGTGILTQHFVERVRFIAAIEPDASMRAWAERSLGQYPAFHSISACAEKIPLPDHSMDVIVVGQAIHWFAPTLAQPEFCRILNSAGSLVVIWNQPTEQQLGHSLHDVCSAENGWELSNPARQPVDLAIYFGHGAFTRQEYKVTQKQTWEQFLGALCSDSHAPAADHPAFTRFTAAAQRVFDQRSVDGELTSTYLSIVNIGQVKSGATRGCAALEDQP